ncbi:c-type cytochrome [Allorhodopirellula solitaria]|uniref:Cytochrome c n=1 Tax=Allorhodopirellula solitaria TaxID=2527987 RepID=A0A5C5YFD0_9BACT|nr:hypothetical protein [Allorhodopirellula solitaria]TWT73231.1 Cytochrome c [Allorhodopirellula solitaria]
MRHLCSYALVFITAVGWSHARLTANDPSPRTSPAGNATASDQAEAASRGFERLVNTAYLPSDFDQEVFDNLWKSWPEPLRQKAADASVGERRAMAFDRYGLTQRPHVDLGNRGNETGVSETGVSETGGSEIGDGHEKGDGGQERQVADPGKPLQYVVDKDGNWTMNCFACHGGSIYGSPTPGAPNNQYALQTLTEEVRSTKFRLGKPLGRMELGSLVIPLGTTHGTTNAVVFGMGLMHFRDDQLNLIDRPPTSFTHHDMDAPPWWHFYRRPYIYIDGFAPKGHRGLMQFMLVPENDADFFREHEDEFRDVEAYLSSLRAPRYAGPVDEVLASRGAKLFASNCAECHGTYDNRTDSESIAGYPNRMVPIEEIGTDPVRHDALTVAGREHYSRSWFAATDDAEHRETITDPAGYVAPPLDGVWASAPYFHNGSVPTLWHVLHPDQRPVIWRRTAAEMDQSKVGLSIETTDRVPLETPDVAIRRSYFDTRRFGKSSDGHDYPNRLSEPEKRAVLEYLKTL